LAVLESEPGELRPRDSAGLPGGLVDLPAHPVAVIPDLHARPDFLAAVLAWKPPGFERSMAELLDSGAASLCCLGDAFHTETGEAQRRWASALRERRSGWAESAAMDQEMGYALSTAATILEAKVAFPCFFHFIKGNHDNVANEEGGGDHPFYKFAASWFGERYGGDLLASYRALEKSFPLLVRGERFIASHSEPAFALSYEEVLEYRRRPEVVEALIWTANDEARPDAVAKSLDALISAPDALWFAGHRPVRGKYSLRAGGLFVQFHAPSRWPVAFLTPGARPDPDRDIRYLD
jgi:hypothetical protein